MHPFPVIDLHADLLLYLASSKGRLPTDLQSRCSLPDLRKGGVKLQVLPIFTYTNPQSVCAGLTQAALYEDLCGMFPSELTRYGSGFDWSGPLIALLPAFENASGFCSEEEPFTQGVKRLEQLIAKMGKPAYISLTWNGENRFGGGSGVSIGLKNDGKRLLEVMNDKQIAVDLSHASDHLACDILDFIDQQNLTIPVIASHSNSRTVADRVRNLPDEIIQEIFRKKGIVGLAFCRQFVGEDPRFFCDHIAHLLDLKGEDHIALGADFFYEKDLPPHLLHDPDPFFSDFQNSSCYPAWFEFIFEKMPVSRNLLEKIAFINANCFIEKI